MIDDNDQDRQKAHKRLRDELDEQGRDLKAVQHESTENKEAIALLNERLQAPVSFDKIFLSPRVWLMMIGWLMTTVVAIVVAILATTSGIRADLAQQQSDIRDILTKMEAAKTADAARDKLRDVEGSTLRNDVTEVKRLQQLQQYDIQNLKDLVRQKAGTK